MLLLANHKAGETFLDDNKWKYDTVSFQQLHSAQLQAALATCSWPGRRGLLQLAFTRALARYMYKVVKLEQTSASFQFLAKTDCCTI